MAATRTRRALYNALSATFPKGEAFFVESVRAYRDGAPDKLARGNPGFHDAGSRSTAASMPAFNRRAADAGYDLSPLEAKVDERLALTARQAADRSLAATMALEHFTAILAHELLADPRHLAGADQASAELWRWHAAEEIEHKGVAYDTWLHATRDWPRCKRWKVKAKVMLFVTRNFVVDRTPGALELLRQDGITGPQAWRGLLWYAVVRARHVPQDRRRLGWPTSCPASTRGTRTIAQLIADYEASGGLRPAPRRKVRRAQAAWPRSAAASDSSPPTLPPFQPTAIRTASRSPPRAQL